MIADTIKGKGIRLIEHTNVMRKNKYYNWHSGATSDELYVKMVEDVVAIQKILKNKLTFNPFKVLKSKNSYNKYISTDIH